MSDWLDDIEARVNGVDGYDDHARQWEDLRRLLAEVRRLLAVARAAEARLRSGHNDTCGAELSDTPYPCTCGHDDLRAAIAGSDTDAR